MIERIYTLFALLLVAALARKLYTYISVARFKRKHGCKPANKIPQWETIVGYEAFKKQGIAAKEKRLLEMARTRYDTVGNTWSVSIVGKTFYNTVETENIKAVLATNFKDFGLGTRQEAFGALLGQGIFTTDGAQWEHSRALVRPNFTRSQVADLDTFEPHIQALIAKIPRDGSTVDLQTLFFQLTLDSATEFLFGESVNSLSSPDDSPQHEFGKNFDFAQSKMSLRSRLGPFLRFYRDKEFNAACAYVHEFVDRIVKKALKNMDPIDFEKPVEKRYVFLDELVKATRNPKQLRDELLNILLAGRDTTASLLSHTFHVLARRPDIWAKLKAEVDTLDGKKPDYETLRNLKYLKYVLTESLRLYPVVPTNGRFAVRDTVLPRGGGPHGTAPLFIPRGAVVAYSPYSLHRRTDIYGTDALSFRPERWAPEENLRPGWGYLPFNGGPRICVGQQFALTEASYTIVRLMQEFGAVEDRDGSAWLEGLALTLACGNGVKVAMVPR